MRQPAKLETGVRFPPGRPLVPSSIGRGHHPFTVEKRVRFPPGLPRRCTIAGDVERSVTPLPPGLAGSNPATCTPWIRSSIAQSTWLLTRGLGVRIPRGPPLGTHVPRPGEPDLQSGWGAFDSHCVHFSYYSIPTTSSNGSGQELAELQIEVRLLAWLPRRRTCLPFRWLAVGLAIHSRCRSSALLRIVRRCGFDSRPGFTAGPVAYR